MLHHSINCKVVAGVRCHLFSTIHPKHLVSFLEIQPRMQQSDSLHYIPSECIGFNFLTV